MPESVSIRDHVFASMFEFAPLGMVLLAPDSCLLRVNRAFCAMVGYSPDQMLELPANALSHPDDWQEELGRRARLTAGAGSSYECDRRFLHRDGHIVWGHLACALVRDEAGRPLHFIAQVQDITERMKADATERRRAEKEIVLLNNVLEQRIRKRTAELEESNEDLRDFAHSLAHDLRAPLASIDGFSAQLELGLAAQLDDKSRHYLKRVRAGVKLMADLTDALLGLADLSNTQLLHQSVDLSALARGIMERLHEQEPEREVSVVIEDTPQAQGDVRLLTDVMENLLGNAWKFTSRMPRANITFGGQSWSNGSYLYHVKDNGAGFDPAYGYKLFGPFQRLHTAAEFEGTGIGLAMVRKIVSRHGGRVWAESVAGAGADFYFTLNESAPPRVAGESPAGASAE
jgi:PAS domain S-box-containing protein